MTTGFMITVARAFAASVAALALAAPVCSQAADIAVNALFNGKAMLVIDGGKPRMLNAGETSPEGVKLVSAASDAAVIEYKGQRQTLSVGQGTRVAVATPSSGLGRVVLTADSRGHFYANGSINGVSVRFMVDTGATNIALSAADARRMGINYLAGTRGQSMTANGVVNTYRVRLDNVRVGDIVLNNVEAGVHENSLLPFALLGMSFLNRTQMNRDGDQLTLTRRY
jgi:aspartyl protease family protein